MAANSFTGVRPKLKIFAHGAIVEIAGLAGRADLNGQQALVLGWASEPRRWAVHVETGGEEVRVKPRNLLLKVPASGAVPANDEEEEPCMLERETGSALYV
ncbi:hypothetical protein T492DRAFT_900841 [Pavlovales sp. CCMP2436]|nr:hypothetical protein T492DRAFT_900841 [Pavlovales sp. CCMP2436]